MQVPAESISRRHVVTRDADELSDFVTRNIAPGIARPLTAKGPLEYSSRFIVGDRFIASRGALSHGLDLEPMSELDVVMVYLGLSGTVRIDTPKASVIGTNDTILVSASRTVKRVVFSPARDEIVIAVSADCVRRRMGAFLGFEVDAAFDFLISVDVDSGLGTALFGFGSTLHWALDGNSLLQSSPIGLCRTKDAFIDLTLSALGTEALVSLAGPPQSASQRQVNAAEEFMRSSSHLPIGVPDIAAHVSVSVRALQYAFRQHRDTTPLAVLQRLRLEGFRRELLAGSPELVARIAARWGFTHLGRLARNYRASFGEKPSDTATRARRGDRGQAHSGR